MSGGNERDAPIAANDQRPKHQRAEEATAHEMAGEIIHALGWRNMLAPLGSYEIEPPDGEDEPTSFGLSKDGKLRWIVSVEPW